MTYPDTQLFIDGAWQDAADGRSLPVQNPASGAEIGRVAHAGIADLDKALAAADRGFQVWRDFTPAERSKILRKAAGLMRERAGDIAALLTQEQGKPLIEAKGGVLDMLDEECMLPQGSEENYVSKMVDAYEGKREHFAKVALGKKAVKMH